MIASVVAIPSLIPSRNKILNVDIIFQFEIAKLICIDLRVDIFFEIIRRLNHRGDKRRFAGKRIFFAIFNGSNFNGLHTIVRMVGFEPRHIKILRIRPQIEGTRFDVRDGSARIRS